MPRVRVQPMCTGQTLELAWGFDRPVDPTNREPQLMPALDVPASASVQNSETALAGASNANGSTTRPHSMSARRTLFARYCTTYSPSDMRAISPLDRRFYLIVLIDYTRTGPVRRF